MAVKSAIFAPNTSWRMIYFFRGLVFIFLTVVSVAQSKDFKLLYENGKVGLANNDGTVIIPPIYDQLGWSNGAEMPNGNFIGYKSNNLWGLLALDNQVVTNAEYARLYPTQGGLYVASKQGKISHHDFLGVINSQGKIVIPFKYTSIQLTDLRAIVSVKHGKNYNFGLVDLADKTIIPTQFKEIFPLGNLRFAVKDFNNKTAIFNDKGKAVVDFSLDSISGFVNGYATLYANHLRGIINANGQIIAPIQYKEVQVADGIPQVKTFDEWHFIVNNQTSKKWFFDDVTPYAQNHYKVLANGRTWIKDSSGLDITPLTYEYVGELIKNKALFKYRNKWGVMLQNGQTFMDAQYDSIVLLQDVIFAKNKGLWNLFDHFGLKKSDQNYTDIGNKTGYYFPVKKKKHWGFINQSGEETIHCVYEWVGEFNHNKVVVKFHGQYGILDKSGEWIVLPQADKLQLINDNYYMAYGSKLSTLKSYADGTVYFTENKVDIMDDHLIEHLSDDGLWKINFKGQIVNKDIPRQRFEEVRTSSEGLFAVRYNGRYGFVDYQNRLLIANRYENVGDFSEGLVSIQLLNRWGFIDRNENIVIQPVYESVTSFKNGLAIAQAITGFGLIDKQGKKISAFDYDEITRFDDGKFMVRKGDAFGLLSKSGHLLVNAKYEILSDLGNGYVMVGLFGKLGIITEAGVDIIPIQYDKLHFDTRSGIYLAMKKSGWVKVTH